jgi:hypothetical protein
MKTNVRKKPVRKPKPPVAATEIHTASLYPKQHAATGRLMQRLELDHSIEESTSRGDLHRTLQSALQCAYDEALHSARVLVTNIMPDSRDRDRLLEKLDGLLNE